MTNAAEAVLGLSVDGCITQANAEAERIFGYTWEELVGQPLRLLVPDPTALPYDAERLALAKLRDGVRVRTGCLRKDGSSFPAGVSLSRMDSDRGVLITAAIQDLSLDDQLAYAQQLAAALVALGPDAVVVTDPDGVIRQWSPAAERLYGYRPEEVLGHDAGMLTAPGSADTRVTRDGSRVRVSVQRAPLTDGAGRTIALVELSRAVPPAPDAPATPAPLSLDSLGRLAAGVGHNFNNLLAIVAAHASMLAEELAAVPVPASQRAVWLDDIEHIQRAVRRAAEQTRQLLTFGGRGGGSPVALDVGHLMTGLVPVLRGELAETVRLSATCAPDVWPVRADPGQIEQVLLNLVANARDAMPHGGRIDIRADNAPPGDAGRFVRVQVRDSGTGMPPEVAERAFEPFFSTKPAAEAGGMGLAVVHAVVSDSGGRVAIASSPGAGTTVTLLLPATDEQPVTPARPVPIGPAGPPRGEDRTILVIEDEDDLRGAVHRMLSGSGYRILVATDGMHAIRIAATHPGPLDLLLSDVVMPEMSGPEIAEEIRAIRPGVRVVFMSGYDRSFLTAQGQLGPGTDVMQKPFSRDALLATLAQALAR